MKGGTPKDTHVSRQACGEVEVVMVVEAKHICRGKNVDID